jgi:HSP20 family protein
MLPILFDSLLEDSFFRPFNLLKTNNFNMLRHIPLNVEEKEAKYIITAELPGINKEEINVTLKDGLLNIEVSSESKKEDVNYTLKEICYAYKNRSISIPKGIKEDQVIASMKDGLLTIQIEKIPKEVTTKKILIN